MVLGRGAQGLLARLGQAVEALQVAAGAVQAVGQAVGELLHRRVAAHEQAAARGLGEAGTPKTHIEIEI